MKSTQTEPVALVTGGARRLGASIARHLHQAGYRIMIHYRHSAEDAQKLCEQLNQRRSHSAGLVQADFVEDVYTEVIAITLRQWQRLDVVINNASSYYPTPIECASRQQWDALMQSNLTAPYFLSVAAAPHLQSVQGSIINLSDVNAQQPKKDYSIFCIAKAGLNMLTQVLAKELAPRVRVNAIAPMTTIWAEGQSAPTVDQQDDIIEKTLLKRKTEPADVNSAVMFLLQQPAITGQVITLDNGKLLGAGFV